MEREPIKVKAWAVIDCKWNKIRSIEFTRKDAKLASGCAKCRIIKVEIKEV
jgi:hypothetical protein